MHLFPLPQRVAIGEKDAVRSSRSLALSFEPTPQFQTAAQNLGFLLCRGSAIVAEIDSRSKPTNGYAIVAADSALRIAASSEAALFLGLVTLRQILRQREQWVPELSIEDWPDLAVRGFMLDISRCKVPTMASLFALIDLLVELKYNQLQLYTEHTFAYRDHAVVWAEASPLTASEILSLDAYCRERYIELVPNQNTFGHMERWLRHPRYHPLAESPGGFEHPISGWKPCGSTLKPNQDALDFVDSLFAELLPHFSSRQVNVGGDEPWELGQGWSAPIAWQRGKRQLYVDHLRGIQDLATKRGCRMQFWGDIVIEEPELARQLQPGALGLLWGYEANHPFAAQCAAFAAAGVPFCVVPGTSCWNSIGGRLQTAVPNIESACRSAIEQGAEGILLTEWGDNGHHQPFAMTLIPLALAAAQSWNRHAAATADDPTIEQMSFALGDALGASLPQLRELSKLGYAGSEFSAHLHNATWLNKILFAGAEQMKQISASVAPSEIATAENKLQGVSADASSRDLVDQEIALARDILLFATAKYRAFQSMQASPRLAATGLLERFEEVWLARNRPGGLPESLQRLREGAP